MPSFSAAAPWVRRLRAMTSLIAKARRSLVWRSSASAQPRSANTLPVPRVIAASSAFVVLAFRLAIVSLVILLGDLQSSPDQVDIDLCRPEASRRLLLESVQDVDDFPESHRVDRTVGVAVVILDDLENSGTLALPGLGGK